MTCNVFVYREAESNSSFDTRDEIMLGGFNPAFESQVSSVISLSDDPSKIEKKLPCCQRALRRDIDMKLKKKQLGSDADCETDSSDNDGPMTMAKRRGKQLINKLTNTKTRGSSEILLRNADILSNDYGTTDLSIDCRQKLTQYYGDNPAFQADPDLIKSNGGASLHTKVARNHQFHNYSHNSVHNHSHDHSNHGHGNNHHHYHNENGTTDGYHNHTNLYGRLPYNISLLPFKFF